MLLAPRPLPQFLSWISYTIILNLYFYLHKSLNYVSALLSPWIIYFFLPVIKFYILRSQSLSFVYNPMLYAFYSLPLTQFLSLYSYFPKSLSFIIFYHSSQDILSPLQWSCFLTVPGPLDFRHLVYKEVNK